MTSGAVAVPITALVLAAPDVPAATRAVAVAGAADAAAAGGGIAVTTCHRAELYLDAGAADLVAQSGSWAEARRLEGEDAVRHMISLAVGLESAVLAEDQVLHQLRAGVAAARARGTLPSGLDVLADHALRAGRTARSWRPTRSRSLADLAVDRLRAAHGSLVGRRVLVVGAGEMGRLAAMAAARSGAEVTVASPTPAHATAVAADVGGIAVAFDPGAAGVGVDGVVIALSGPWPAVPTTFAALHACPLVVDLSMPGALPRAVVRGMGARFVDLDALAWRGDPATGGPAEERYRRRLVQLREAAVRAVVVRIESRPAPAVARALAERVERQRAEHLQALWSRLPELSDRDRAAIEGMTAHLTDRLFRAPLARLGSDGDDRRVAAARELFDL